MVNAMANANLITFFKVFPLNDTYNYIVLLQYNVCHQ